MKILNLGELQGTGGVAPVLDGSDDEAVDPHLNRIKNAREGGENDSDEEVGNDTSLLINLQI
jgi:structure-specific recognition protein 1